MIQGWHRETRIPRAIAWRGYTVPCGRCGSEAPWTLRVQNTCFGLDAWLICPEGHNDWNPLIYPEIALRFLAAPDFSAMLNGLDHDPAADWYPRIRLIGDVNALECAPDGADTSRWNPFVRTAVTKTPYYAEQWPGIWAADGGGARVHGDLQ